MEDEVNKMKKIIIGLLVLILLVSVSFNVVAGYNRFISIKTERDLTKIIIDQKTGVNYLLVYRNYGINSPIAITVMYDSNGKILVEK
jgi:hypothetical protein